MRLFAPILLVLLATACVADPPEDLLEADPTAPAALGERGPWGVTVIPRDLTDEAGRTVTADVFLPTGLDDEGPFPPVVFVQGGLVPVERYRWLGVHMASRGFVVASPKHLLDLAFFAGDNPTIALGGLRAAAAGSDDELAGLVNDAPALIAGHSLGGVVAAKVWLNSPPEDIRHLALLASVPDTADDVGAREAGRVLSVTGSVDAKLTPAEALDGAVLFDERLTVAAVVDGMNHYQWTDDATDGELADDGEPTLSLVEARRLALYLLDSQLADLAGGDASALDDPALWPEGLVANE